jgi:hypothetical protein
VFRKGGLATVGQIPAKYMLDHRGGCFLCGGPFSFVGDIDFDESLGKCGEGGRAEADLIAGMTLF